MANLTWLLARRFRRNHGKNGFLSFISASSTMGIALGCAVLITGLAVMNGFQQVLETRFLRLVPHIEYTAVQGSFKSANSALEQLRSQPSVTSAQAVISTQAMVQQGSEFKGMQLTGIAVNENTGNQPHAVREFMPASTWQALQQRSGGVVLGVGLAQQLQVSAGDQLQVLVASGQDFREPKRHQLQVVGTFEFGGELDYRQAFVGLKTAQQLTGLGEGVTSLQVQLADIYAAPRLAMELGNQLDEYVYIDHWVRSQGHLYRDIQLVRVVMYLILVLVMAVACFNIVSTLIMTVQEKMAQIAILKTMGMRHSALLRVFVWQGLQSGISGTVLGILGGILLALSLPELIHLIEQMSGSKVLSGDVYFVDQVPTLLAVGDVVLVGCVALVMSILATLYPAWRAAQVSPVHALHNN
ncbi:lipoprotein-releasing system permease protein [Pseudidiomarina planktonica]|uniref:Lipoprotein-releasing system permease protein n=1 Tax=Pseudidiomarina planktonica TaxID=1323738 RepID=A0A1Y6EYV3_9GAMM|nr:lipoprotein-releasing ABC transporter permease subunit [Pseudidiomarina planktonica]RUO65158.1 lipoprotein-releasing system transmembrane subunit, LolC/LolE family [Pseudidiomarina planktonica]SMQ66240.1 lipoprotein-releasing system permease protein [Pseudidiomarina planktonica]